MDFEKTLKSIKERTKRIDDSIYEHDMNMARVMRELSRYTRDTLTHLANIDKTLAEMQIVQNTSGELNETVNDIIPVQGIMYRPYTIRDDQIFAIRIIHNIYLVIRKTDGVLAIQQLDYTGFSETVIVQPNDILTDGSNILLNNVEDYINALGISNIISNIGLTGPALMHEIRVPNLLDNAVILNYSTFDRNDGKLYTNILFGLNGAELISDEDSVSPVLYLAANEFIRDTPCFSYNVSGVFALEFNTELTNRCVPNIVFILSMVSGINNKDEHTTMNGLLGYVKNFTRQHFKFKYYGYDQLNIKYPTIRELEIAETLMSYTAKELDICL